MNTQAVSGTHQSDEHNRTPLKYIAMAAVGAIAASVAVTNIFGGGLLTRQPGMVERLAQCGYQVESDVANLGTNLRLTGNGLEAIMEVGPDGLVAAGTPVSLVGVQGAGLKSALNVFYPDGTAPAGAVLANAIASGLCPGAANTGYTGGGR